MSETDSVS